MRNRIRELRRKHDPSAIRQKSRAIWERFSSLQNYRSASAIALYCSIVREREVMTIPMIEMALVQGKKVCLPKVMHDSLEFFSIRDVRQDLSEGAFGILEPITGDRVDPQNIDLVVVPGVAFDVKGNRVGFGRGYYDRFLRRARKRASIVALAFEFQIVDRVPATEYDVRVHKIVTEKRVIECTKLLGA